MVRRDKTKMSDVGKNVGLPVPQFDRTQWSTWISTHCSNDSWNVEVSRNMPQTVCSFGIKEGDTTTAGHGDLAQTQGFLSLIILSIMKDQSTLSNSESTSVATEMLSSAAELHHRASSRVPLLFVKNFLLAQEKSQMGDSAGKGLFYSERKGSFSAYCFTIGVLVFIFLRRFLSAVPVVLYCSLQDPHYIWRVETALTQQSTSATHL